jgi:hypothetical protein
MYNYQINKITREMQMDSTIPEKYKQNFDVSKEGHCIFQVVESICISLGFCYGTTYADTDHSYFLGVF